jgi:hypothetical protein
MQHNNEPLLNALLVRWHRWAEAAVRLDDSLLRDFDAVVAKVPPRLRVALAMHARNLACGATVWSSPRVDRTALTKAKRRLHALLEPDATRWFGPVVVQLNERGNRIGESNPRAEVPDHDVDLCREMRAEGYSYGWLAAKFEVAKSTVASWCQGTRRGQLPVRVKEVAR